MLSVHDSGNCNGQPALFIHGFMSSNHQWELNRERLQAELRTVFVELPGHGRSPTPDDADTYSPPRVLAAIDEIRRELGIEQWWVIGHSLGGAIALRYALAHPQKVKGVVFTNSRAAFGFSRGSEDPRVRHATTPADLRELPFHPIHAKRFPKALKQRMVEAADAIHPEVVVQLGANARQWQSRDELNQLTPPVLLVNGRWEKAFQPHVASARSAIADLQVVELEGGHSINVEQPEQFDHAVLDFIAANGTGEDPL